MGKLQPTRLPKYFFNSKQHTAQPTPRLQETARHIYNTKPRNKQPVIQYHITNQKPAIRYETPRLQEKACHTIRNNETTVLQHLNFRLHTVRNLSPPIHSLSCSAKPLASKKKSAIQYETAKQQNCSIHYLKFSCSWSRSLTFCRRLSVVVDASLSNTETFPPASALTRATSCIDSGIFPCRMACNKTPTHKYRTKPHTQRKTPRTHASHTNTKIMLPTWDG